VACQIVIKGVDVGAIRVEHLAWNATLSRNTTTIWQRSRAAIHCRRHHFPQSLHGQVLTNPPNVPLQQ
jgi:hypothetical protein